MNIFRFNIHDKQKQTSGRGTGAGFSYICQDFLSNKHTA